MEEKNEKNSVGRPPRYLTIKKFEEFLANDFHGLKKQVSELKWWFLSAFAVIAILVTLFGSLIITGR